MGAPRGGARASLELPKLERFEPTTSAIVAGDWLASLAPVMASLGPSADRFWSDAKESAQFVYDRRVASPPLERLRTGIALVGIPERTNGLCHYYLLPWGRN